MLLAVRSREQNIDSIVAAMDAAASNVPIPILGVFANHLAIKAAGHIERSVREILAEYGARHGNRAISAFIEETVRGYNSLNCEKIQRIFYRFSADWWTSVEAGSSKPSRDAVDSLKTIRDALAHGRDNGTSLSTIKEYYASSKVFIATVDRVILP